MFRKNVSFLVLIGLFLGFTGCKGKNESNGDSFLKEGKYRNAVNSYTNALKKGKVSKDFYDNFVIAYTAAAKQTAKKNSSDDIIRNYVEQIHKNMPNVKKASTLDSVVAGLSEIGVAQVKDGYEYEYILQGFRNLDSAISIAKRGNVNGNVPKTARDEAEKVIVAKALENSKGAENEITAEYILLEAEVVAPNNEQLKKALDAIRVKNRGTFLIFAEDIIGQRASRMVDKYGYVLAFPILSITPAGITGEIQIWNATGNNAVFEPNKLKVISKTGEEAAGKYVGRGYCNIDRVDEKTGMFKSVNQPFKGNEGELRSEKTCNAQIAFAYGKGFEPAYVDYKDNDNNIGRKYFGQR